MSEPEQRLIISKIVNENFKSYAGTRVLGPFHKSFTAIVGPNGSGKSNVIDAILFVFGFRSSKIRSKKLSQLIHQSENFPSLTSCTVSVHFQVIRIFSEHSESFEVVQEFVVSRTARADNSSDYYIDNSKCNYKQVQEFLKSYDIDLDHNRFLILQGEVEQISLMKPKAPTDHEIGFLEYLEDIIGTGSLQEVISQLQIELDTLGEQRVEKYNRVKAIESEKNSLEAEREVALQYVNTENEVATLKTELLVRKKSDILGKIQEISEKEHEVIEKHQNAQNEFDGMQNECKLIREKHKSLKESLQPFFKEVEVKTALVNNLEKRCIRATEEKQKYQDLSKKLQDSLKTDASKLEENRKTVDVTSANLEKYSKSKEKLMNEYEDEEKLVNRLLEKCASELEPYKVQLEKVEEALFSKKETQTKCKSEYSSCHAKLEAVNLSAKSSNERLEEQARILEDQERSLDSQNNRLESFAERSEALRHSVAQKIKLDVELKRKFGDLNDSFKSTKEKLNYFVCAQSSKKSRKRIYSSLEEASKSGAINAQIYGRLGDLGVIDDKYDVAVSSASPSLDHILVETVDDAVKCVEFLRAHNLGTISFIALEKMREFEKNTTTPIRTPRNVPRLFDLIEFTSKKFSTAFYFALRDTLVVENIDEATVIAFQGEQRYRVVTLSGEILEKSGTISAGGSKISGKLQLRSAAKNRKMSLDPAELDSLRNQESEMNDNIQKLTREIDENEKSLKQDQNELADLELNIKKIKVQIASLEKQIVESRESLSNLEKESKTAVVDEREIEKLSAILEKKMKQLKSAEDEVSKTEAQKKKITDKVDSIKSSVLGSQKQKLESIRKLIDEVDSQINKNRAENHSSLATVKKLEKKSEENEMQCKELLLKVSELNENVVSLQGELDQAKVDLNQATQQLDLTSVDLRSLEQDLAEAESKLTEKQQLAYNSECSIKNLTQKLSDLRNEELGCDKLIEAIIHRTYSERDGQEIVKSVKYDEFINDPKFQGYRSLAVPDIKTKITLLEQHLTKIKPNFGVLEEYRKKIKIYLERITELEALNEIRDEKRRELDSAKKKRLDQFMEGFTLINLKLKELYQLITLGGDAELELVDSLNPFSEGIEFSVRPPNKSWKKISNLSGGEKTLSSLSLVFALHHYKPTPFYVMDEIDAALDFKNVSIIANYIKEKTKNVQFIIISLRNNMFELANLLVGIFKVENCSRTVALDPSPCPKTEEIVNELKHTPAVNSSHQVSTV